MSLLDDTEKRLKEVHDKIGQPIALLRKSLPKDFTYLPSAVMYTTYNEMMPWFDVLHHVDVLVLFYLLGVRARCIEWTLNANEMPQDMEGSEYLWTLKDGWFLLPAPVSCRDLRMKPGREQFYFRRLKDLGLLESQKFGHPPSIRYMRINDKTLNKFRKKLDE